MDELPGVRLGRRRGRAGGSRGGSTLNERTLALIFLMNVTRTGQRRPKCGHFLQSCRNQFRRPQLPDYP